MCVHAAEQYWLGAATSLSCQTVKGNVLDAGTQQSA